MNRAIHPEFWTACVNEAQTMGFARDRAEQLADAAEAPTNGVSRYAEQEHAEGDAKRAGEHHVLLDDDGNIVGGSVPKEMHGKPVEEFAQHIRSQKAKPAEPKPEPKPESEPKQEAAPAVAPASPAEPQESSVTWGPRQHGPERLKNAVARLKDLEANIGERSYGDIETTVASMAKEFDAAELKQVAREFGLSSGLGTKANTVRKLAEHLSENKMQKRV